MPILDYFPLPRIRPAQTHALEYVERVFGLGYTDIVIEAPTGVGKSAIGATVALWGASLKSQPPKVRAKGGYLLVNQKVLQDQLAADLPRLDGAHGHAALIKSAVEYVCPTHKLCSVGSKKRCSHCRPGGDCAYKVAKSKFCASELGITNYAYYFTERQFVGELADREVLVADECHNLAKLITRHVDCIVSEKKLEEWAPSLASFNLRQLTTLGAFTDWLAKHYVPEVKARAADLAALASDDPEMLREAFEFENHACKVASACERIMAEPKGWVFWHATAPDGDLELTARPLSAAPFTEELLGGAALRVFMSAYPGEKGTFCRELGLDPSRVAWLRLPSTFPLEHRPVHLATVGSMSKRDQAQTIPAALRMLDTILAANPERGLIHPHSYALANQVAEHLNRGPHAHRLRFPRQASEREEAMEEHFSTPGSVLMSPSIGEGFDFKGDKARWQVILKAPWASLGDKQVATKAQQDSNWYDFETLKSLLQACGRVCRSEDDTGTTYILDADAERLLRRYHDRLPKWFTAGLIFNGATP